MSYYAVNSKKQSGATDAVLWTHFNDNVREIKKKKKVSLFSLQHVCLLLSQQNNMDSYRLTVVQLHSSRV